MANKTCELTAIRNCKKRYNYAVNLNKKAIFEYFSKYKKTKNYFG